MLLKPPALDRHLVDAPYAAPMLQSGAAEVSPLQAVLRYKWAILLFAVVLTGVGFLIVHRIPPRYTASASIVVDARKMQVIDAQSVLSSPLLDLDRLRTYMEQLRSPAIAKAVVEQLDLTHVPEYCTTRAPAGAGLLAALHLRAAPAAASCDVSADDAAEHLLQVVSGSNDGRSYIIKINAEAADPKLAAAIANAYARAYVVAQRTQVQDAAEQADTWLASYLKGLREQMQAADGAVERYQRENQLTPLRGETVISQRLAELNSQLTVATSALEDKQASLRQVQSAPRDGGQLNASAPAVLASPLIQQLVQKQTDLQATLADLRSKYGDAYPAVQAATAQLDRMRQAIQLEVGKVISGLGGEVAALTARKAALTATVQQLQQVTGDQGTANVRLQELQDDAKADHRLYEAMLTRLHQVDAERHMQWPDSSVAVEARPPSVPSFPRVKMMLAGIFMVSLGVGAAVAFGLTLVSRVFRDLDQMEAETGMRVLGLFPKPPRRSSPTRMVLEQPASLEAETLQFILPNLHLSQDSGAARGGRVIMISSAMPQEGKTSFAIAVGQSAISTGLTVAVLDCDVRSPAASRMFGGKDATAGFPAAKSPSGTAGGNALVTQPQLQVMAIASCIPEPRKVLSATDVAIVLERLRSHFDLVLVDTPPILALPDALTLAPLIDEAVLIVDWDRTLRRSVLAAIRVLRRGNVEIAGIVLSKVDLRRLSRRSVGEGFYARSYSGYRRA